MVLALFDKLISITFLLYKTILIKPVAILHFINYYISGLRIFYLLCQFVYIFQLLSIEEHLSMSQSLALTCSFPRQFIKQTVPAFQPQWKRCMSFKIVPLDTLFQIVFRPARYNDHSDINILIGIDL